MNRILMILTVIFMMTLNTTYSHAQSASESYDNGLALMKKQDYSGAIACFKASMAINKSAANIKMPTIAQMIIFLLKPFLGVVG